MLFCCCCCCFPACDDDDDNDDDDDDHFAFVKNNFYITVSDNLRAMFVKLHT